MFSAAPAVFELPCASVEGLAAECALRISFAEFKRVSRVTLDMATVSPHLSRVRAEQLRLGNNLTSPAFVAEAAGSSSAANAEGEDAAGLSALRSLGCVGAPDIIALMERQQKALRTDGLSDHQWAVGKSVERVVLGTIQPAFEYLLLADSATFEKLQPFVQREANLLDVLRLQPTAFRERRVNHLRSHFEMRSTDEAIKKLEEGLTILEKLLAMNVGGSADASKDSQNALGVTQHFLNTPIPTAADCYAYGAFSALLHGDFGSKALLSHAKAKIMPALRLGTIYAENVRQQFFSSYGGSYAIRPIPDSLDPPVEDAFRKGRTATFIGTAAFASVYFVMSNAATIVALLQYFGGVSDDELAEGEMNGDDPSLDEVMSAAERQEQLAAAHGAPQVEGALGEQQQ